MRVSGLNSLYLAVFCFALYSCSNNGSPKPRGYNRIDLPKAEYQTLQFADFPYSFEYSAYARANLDTQGFFEPYWINLLYPQMSANIQLTYYPLKKNRELFYELLNDTYTLANKHQIKASAIEQLSMVNPKGHSARLFLLKGEVPSQVQFFITDSTNHFLRGALYFKTATKNDSLAPVIDFIQADIVHMIQTTDWKKAN
jgi:gliding motility-associated lipoprotein GldD